MKYFYSYLFVISFFLAGFLSCICPYPIFSSAGTLTAYQQQIINDANEFENRVTTSVLGTAVVSLDWFDTVDSLFTKFENTRVIDVLTKKIYVVQRTGGHYHADVEPINAENKEIFYEIYDHNWSWARRPALVEINGIWVAASINGMPHGYSLIPDNDQNGHSCIHFLNSKTHGTQRVDEAHQEAISYALKNANIVDEIFF